jgi:hypothetical protein
MKNGKAISNAADAGHQALKVLEESTAGEAAPNDAPASEMHSEWPLSRVLNTTASAQKPQNALAYVLEHWTTQ